MTTERTPIAQCEQEALGRILTGRGNDADAFLLGSISAEEYARRYPVPDTFPEMKNPVPTPDLRPVEGPNNDPEQVTMRQRADEWRKIANERLAERRRLNGQGYAGKAEH